MSLLNGLNLFFWFFAVLFRKTEFERFCLERSPAIVNEGARSLSEKRVFRELNLPSLVLSNMKLVWLPLPSMSFGEKRQLIFMISLV